MSPDGRSAEEMLGLVAPALAEEFRLLPGQLRGEVLAMVPYNAARVEQGMLREFGVAVDPAKRVDLWKNVLRETARIVLERCVPAN